MRSERSERVAGRVSGEHSPQAFPLADLGRLAAYQGDGHSAARSGDDYTLDTSPEEMADGDPQMAECLWRSTLSRGQLRRACNRPTTDYYLRV
jgi:hypothetical protein